MSNRRLCLALAPLIGASLVGSATAGNGGGSLERNLHGNGPTVLITDLAADARPLTDRNGIVHAPQVVDPGLVNPWGVAANEASPFWVSENNQGIVTLYDVPGARNASISSDPLVVSVPTPGSPLS